MQTTGHVERYLYLLTVEYRLYWLVGLVYAASALAYAYYAISGRRKSALIASYIAWIGAFLHIALITIRTMETGRAPFQTLYESLSLFAFTAVAAYLYVLGKRRFLRLPGLFVTALASSACFYGLLTRSPAADPLSPPLQSYWFEWHVALAFVSYAVIVVSSAIEISNLIISRLIRSRQSLVLGCSAEDVNAGKQTAYNLVLFGFPLLTFAIFSGAAWANEAWGRYWGWDPKETWSLITWVVFTMYLHAMSIERWRGKTASALNVLGFLCMIMTFIGVNWLVKILKIFSLHAYAV